MKILCSWCFEEIKPEHHKKFGRVFYHDKEYHLNCLMLYLKADTQVQRAIDIAFKEKE